MRLIVGHRGDCRLGLLGDLRDEAGGGDDPVADQQDHRPGLEPADGLFDVADRENADPVEAKSLEYVLQRLGHAFDHYDDWRRARRGSAPHLIFEQASPGEREERAGRARIALLISADQCADRHPAPVASPFFSNRFRGRTKMVNCICHDTEIAARRISASGAGRGWAPRADRRPDHNGRHRNGVVLRFRPMG
jgi:hypothetical protein